MKKIGWHLVMLALVCSSVAACRTTPYTQTMDVKPELKPIYGPDSMPPELLVETEYPLDKSASFYLKETARGSSTSTCPTQVIEDDFGRPTAACIQTIGTAIYPQ